MLADDGSVASRAGIKETCADMDRETVASSLLGSESKGKRDRDHNVVQTLRDRQHKILEGKAELAVRGEKVGSAKFYSKLKQTWRSNTGKREILMLLFMRSLSCSSPNYYSYNRRIDTGVLGRPDKWDSSEQAWPTWTFVMKAYAGGIDEELSTDRTGAEISTDALSNEKHDASQEVQERTVVFRPDHAVHWQSLEPHRHCSTWPGHGSVADALQGWL